MDNKILEYITMFLMFGVGIGFTFWGLGRMFKIFIDIIR